MDTLEVVSLRADGIDVNAGLGREGAALQAIVAGCSDNRKVVVAVTAGHRESTGSWARSCRAKGWPVRRP